MASIYGNDFNVQTYNWLQQYPELNLAPYSMKTKVPEISPITANLPKMSYNTTSLNTATTDITQTATDLSAELLTPEVQSSVASYYKNLGKQTQEASKFYEKANMANKVQAFTNVAQGAMDVASVYANRKNVRMTNRQLDMQKDLIDLNITKSEAILADQFRSAIADLQVVYASKNVDVSSQAVRSAIVSSGEDMGKDMADTRLQGSLQKKAIDFQKAMNVVRQRNQEMQSWINLGANVLSSAFLLI